MNFQPICHRRCKILLCIRRYNMDLYYMYTSAWNNNIGDIKFCEADRGDENFAGTCIE